MKLEIKTFSGKTIYSAEALSIKECVVMAVKDNTYLTEADLTGADLTGADLRGAYLIGAYLRGADLTGANLIGADLTEAHLTEAYLRWADLRRANLTGANLTGADLTGADLRWADLRRANLTGANNEKIRTTKNDAPPPNTNKKTIVTCGQMQKVFVGKFTLSQKGGNVCLDNGEGEWMECRAADIEEVIQDFWDAKTGVA